MKSSDEVLFLFEGSHALDKDAYRTISESILNENPGLKAGAIGPMVVSSDDIVFQFRNRSGIVRMRRSPGLIYIRKEHMLDDEATLTCVLVLYGTTNPHFGTGEESLG
jgi:hypothetical protein